MEVKELSGVGMDYILKNSEGELLDTSEGKQPLYYIHGTGSIIPGLENALVGKAKGDKVSVTIAPEEGYGEKRDDLMQKLDKAQFDIEPEAGMQFQADTGQGPTVITIVEVDETTVTVDGNHPLAGVTLNFDVDLLEVREATKEELDQGRVQADDDACCSDSGCGC